MKYQGIAMFLLLASCNPNLEKEEWSTKGDSLDADFEIELVQYDTLIETRLLNLKYPLDTMGLWHNDEFYPHLETRMWSWSLDSNAGKE